MDKIPQCASLFYLNERSEFSSFYAERLTASEKYEFAPKNKVISTRFNDHISTGLNENISVTEPVEVTGNASVIFNSQALRRKVLSEVSDASAQFGNMPSEASDTSARVGKVSSEASDGFAQSWKVLSETSDGFAQVGNMPSETSDTFAQVGNMLSEVSDGFARVGNMPSEASDASARVGNMPSEASDGFARVGKALSEASDSLTATESRDNVGFDRQKSSVCEFCEAKLVKQGFALRLEPVEITTGNLQT